MGSSGEGIAGAPASAGGRWRLGALAGLEVGVNFALPYLVFGWLQHSLGDVRALLAASLPPLLFSLVEFARVRRVDAASVLALSGIALSLLAFAGGGGVKWLQVREHLAGAAVALVFLGSAAIGRPLIFHLAQASLVRRSAAEAERFAALRVHAGFRRSMTVMTVVWGTMLLASAAAGCALVFVLPIKRYLLVSPLVSYGVFGGLTLWSVWFVRRARARRAAIEARAQGAGSAGR